ncbi:PucR family transcriptional regulator [Streptomyces sp. p1417]|uniref:PucR family transcriptional regulator n=1 Tax=Streptomyces typhae TaxID=2681492 RepID=A0A6L6WQS6_9ACTN|nr:PucR family transcriptional regulator [Streptomyces typhae]MVO84622.1 PucR family transcriptional regulator [Streptomyces typhae]
MEEPSTMPPAVPPATPPGPPAPAAGAGAAPPPTPAVPLTALLAHEELGLRQIAGPDAAATGAVVHWVHTSEMADPYPYLLGGELLLTAGVHIPGTDAGADSRAYDADTYAARIVAAGGAALGFGVAPVHDTVPRTLLDACDRHGLPLLEVPPRTTFSGVARAVWQLMAEARHAELRRVTQAQQGLAAAAARPDAVPALLRQLAVRLGGYAALYGPDGAPTRTAGALPAQEPGADAALARLVEVVTPGAGAGPVPAAASDTLAGVHLAAYPLAGAHGLALGVATPRREPGDHTLAGVAAVLLSLLTAPHQGAAESARSAALVRLLLGARPEDVLPLLGAERWTVVHARVRHTAPEQGPPDPAALAAALGSTLVDSTGAGDGGQGGDAAPPAASGSPVVSAPSAAPAPLVTPAVPAPPLPPVAPVVRLLLPADRGPSPQAGWTLGVSAPAGAGALLAADAQAARALRRAEAARTALVRHRESGLAGLVAPAEADAHARELLAPLGDSAPLTETLRTWLSLHGSWDRTAAALSVHRNTVRQRVARCAALLATDLDDPDVRMELWFALSRRS